MMNLKNKKAFSLIELSIVLLIIGVIIAGVTQSSRMIGAYKLQAARNITQSSPVHSIKDLVLWLEPVMDGSFTNATGSKLIDNSEKISYWNDSNTQATTKINLPQATSGNQPTYISSGINNLPTLQFSGGQFLENTTSVPLAAASKEYTMFVVFQTSDKSNVGLLAHQRGSINCAGDRAGMYIHSGGLSTWGCGWGDITINSTVNLNRPYLGIYRIDNNQANNVTGYLNGVKVGPSATTLSNLGASAFAVGFGASNGTYYYYGYISEIIVFSRALKSDEITDIRAYIAKKYGFSA